MHPDAQALADWLGPDELARVRDWPWDFNHQATLTLTWPSPFMPHGYPVPTGGIAIAAGAEVFL